MTKNSADERRSARARVMLTAVIESRSGRVQVRIDDLSGYGARVLGDCIPPVDTPVTFECNGVRVEGFVAWAQLPLAGIGFGEPVQASEILRKMPVSRNVVPKDFRRPGFRGRQLTNAEMQLVEQWGTPQRTRLGE